MLSSYVFKMVASPKQILLGEYRATCAIFGLAGVGMIFCPSPLFAGTIIGMLHPTNIWLTRRDPYYVDIFCKAWMPLLYKRLHKTKKEVVDA